MSKRKPISQAEFGFTSEAFNLASERDQAQPKAGAPVIMAEMSEAERGAVLEKASDVHDFMCACKRCEAFKDRPIGAKRVEMPGLSPGSTWAV